MNTRKKARNVRPTAIIETIRFDIPAKWFVEVLICYGFDLILVRNYIALLPFYVFMNLYMPVP